MMKTFPRASSSSTNVMAQSVIQDVKREAEGLITSRKGEGEVQRDRANEMREFRFPVLVSCLTKSTKGPGKHKETLK